VKTTITSHLDLIVVIIASMLLFSPYTGPFCGGYGGGCADTPSPPPFALEIEQTNRPALWGKRRQGYSWLSLGRCWRGKRGRKKGRKKSRKRSGDHGGGEKKNGPERNLHSTRWPRPGVSDPKRLERDFQVHSLHVAHLVFMCSPVLFPDLYVVSILS